MQNAVLFDVDGVLVDSFEPHLRSWLMLAGENGFSFTREQFIATFGRTSRDIIAALWPADDLDDEKIRSLDDRKEALYRQIVAANFPAMDGAVELIDALREAGFSLAVGSSGPPENVNLALQRLERADAFGAVVTGSDVTRGKPDPQVYQLAAEGLKIEPARCAVLEDAPAGIDAARAAKMTAIGLASTGRTTKELTDAHLVVTSLRELSAERIGALIERER
ncbi:MAG: HAD family phosphatase [Planctomycetota bacterium]|nr:HAD family phosphatase [Planctomycetota bacterium]